MNKRHTCARKRRRRPMATSDDEQRIERLAADTPAKGGEGKRR